MQHATKILSNTRKEEFICRNITEEDIRGLGINLVQGSMLPHFINLERNTLEAVGITLFEADLIHRHQQMVDVQAILTMAVFGAAGGGGGRRLTPRSSGGGGGESGNTGHRLTTNENQLRHMFRLSRGHFANDTPANRAAIERTAGNTRNFMGTDIHGNFWYVEMQPNGTQIWAKVRNGIIVEAGINATPQGFSPTSGMHQFTPRRQLRTGDDVVMNLSIKQSYLVMFYLLDDFCSKTNDECLTDLLSGFDPYTFLGGMPADPAAWEDWENVVEKITNEDSLTSLECFIATKEFVKFHIDEFGFELEWLYKEIEKLSIESQEWIDCVHIARREK